MKKTILYVLAAVGFCTLLFCALVLFNRAAAQVSDGVFITVPAPQPLAKPGFWEKYFGHYTLDGKKAGAWALCTVGGVAWGVHETIYRNPYRLQQIFGMGDRSWGGPNDWESKYPGGDYQDGEKPVWFKDKTNVFREAKKTTAFVGRYFPITAGVVISLNKKRDWKDYAIGLLFYTASASITYNALQ